jgi:hypothetical protein
MLSNEDRTWLQVLNDKVHPKVEGWKRPVVQYMETSDFNRVVRLVEEHSLLTSMVCTGMFGGYGMEIFEEPSDPLLQPTLLFFLHEEHIPPPTRFERIGGVPQIGLQRSLGAA